MFPLILRGWAAIASKILPKLAKTDIPLIIEDAVIKREVSKAAIKKWIHEAESKLAWKVAKDTILQKWLQYAKQNPWSLAIGAGAVAYEGYTAYDNAQNIQDRDTRITKLTAELEALRLEANNTSASPWSLENANPMNGAYDEFDNLMRLVKLYEKSKNPEDLLEEPDDNSSLRIIFKWQLEDFKSDYPKFPITTTANWIIIIDKTAIKDYLIANPDESVIEIRAALKWIRKTQRQIEANGEDYSLVNINKPTASQKSRTPKQNNLRVVHV